MVANASARKRDGRLLTGTNSRMHAGNANARRRADACVRSVVARLNAHHSSANMSATCLRVLVGMWQSSGSRVRNRDVGDGCLRCAHSWLSAVVVGVGRVHRICFVWAHALVGAISVWVGWQGFRCGFGVELYPLVVDGCVELP